MIWRRKQRAAIARAALAAEAEEIYRLTYPHAIRLHHERAERQAHIEHMRRLVSDYEAEL